MGVVAAVILLGSLPIVSPPASAGDPAAVSPDAPAEREEPPAVERERSKKEEWLADKAARPDLHVSDAELSRAAKARPRNQKMAWKPAVALPAPAPSAGSRITPVTTLFNVRTREALPLLPGLRVERQFHPFLRDHFTNQATRMDERLLGVLSRAAVRFSAPRIEVVSGYRSPKFNLMLRKKGREVARSSQHTEGNAVDFRIRGVPTKQLLKFVRSLRLGGVGYYPHSQFVHSDTGPVRFWKGT